jgi:hypothetical protein
VDLREFEGGSREGMAYWGEVAEWAMAHGQIARAQVVDSAFLTYLAEQPGQDKEIFPIQSFDNEKEALDWLRAQGLKIN